MPDGPGVNKRIRLLKAALPGRPAAAPAPDWARCAFMSPAKQILMTFKFDTQPPRCQKCTRHSCNCPPTTVFQDRNTRAKISKSETIRDIKKCSAMTEWLRWGRSSTLDVRTWPGRVHQRHTVRAAAYLKKNVLHQCTFLGRVYFC